MIYRNGIEVMRFGEQENLEMGRGIMSNFAYGSAGRQ
jgi:hypothetical protein